MRGRGDASNNDAMISLTIFQYKLAAPWQAPTHLTQQFPGLIIWVVWPTISSLPAPVFLSWHSVWSTLIGRGMSRPGCHWSRASLVMLAPAILCHKEPARELGVFCLLLAGSLWHKHSWLPCTDRSYYRRPCAIKNQRRASKIPPLGGPQWVWRYFAIQSP